MKGRLTKMYTNRSSTKSSVSSRYRRSESSQQSQLEKLHQEAQSVLKQKADEIQQFNDSIEEAEKQLAQLKAEFEAKASAISGNPFEDDKFEMYDNNGASQIVEQIRLEQQTEIQQIQAKHEEEMTNLRIEFQKSLQDAEQWADQHAEAVYLERTAQLEDLRRELDNLRNASNETAFASTQNRTKLYQQSKNASLMNSQRIQFLESQLSELSAVTREELRDVRAKIEECLVAVDLREHEHASEIARYQREIAEREEKYNTHLAVLNEQFSNEKARLEQAITASAAKSENLQRVLKQLEKQHEKQLQTTLKDIERMKASIYQARSRDDQKLTDTKSYVSQTHAIQRDCRQIEQEISIVENEIKELQDENRELNNELSRLERTVYGNSNPNKRF